MVTDLVIREISEDGTCLLYVLDSRRNPLEVRIYNKHNLNQISEDTRHLNSKYGGFRYKCWYDVLQTRRGFIIQNQFANRKIKTKNAAI